METKYRLILTGLDGMNSPVMTDKVFTGPNGVQYKDSDGYENFVPYYRVYSIHWKAAEVIEDPRANHPAGRDFTPIIVPPDPRIDYDPLDTGDPERESLDALEPLDQDPGL